MATSSSGALPSDTLPSGALIFDFDSSLIDANTDTIVLDRLDAGLRDRQRELVAELGSDWPAVMTTVLGELTCGPDAVLAAMADVPRFRESEDAVRRARDLGMDTYIVSNGNTVLIGAVLEDLGLSDAFTAVYATPGTWSDDGKLVVAPYHTDGVACTRYHRCPPMMCKARVIESIVAERNGVPYDHLAYVGDSVGDFCALTALDASRNHHALVRGDCSLETLLATDASARARVSLPDDCLHRWTSGADVLAVLERHVFAAVHESSAAPPAS
ncbi:phosphatase phospho1 [Thecamonas trahens ATCC 50062]|uniref:Phosphatase phospho1 n=1 Tax=Thecamonas trahens ATCC 50062 TaxID=461836 RepID=A0A0L0DMV6_THETB|nr:phosphatase phospho1 [Thecamonas trahens ATCC 50062]KNC53634.1 phosphatase phospho1 [Thecamonas trahens ATCC 50062]|eukprot:XP_013761951.1 phosphatase phospho1 [Thecamonas trahens ATCC 50062]